MSVTRTKKPKRENVWLRKMLLGPTGAGKTLGALEIGSKLFGGSLPLYGLDTEHGRMRLYLDRYEMDELFELEGDFAPERFTQVIQTIEKEAPGAVLVIDSISHEWIGQGGILNQADRFGDWKTVRPKHNAFVESMLAAQLHIIVCCRAKMKWEVGEEERPGGGKPKQTITKLGLGPVQSDDIIYEFDILGSIDVATHDCTFSNRCELLVDKTFSLVPGDEVAEIITRWLSEGEPVAPPEAADPLAVEQLFALLIEDGHEAEVIAGRFDEVKRLNKGVLPPEYVVEATNKTIERLAAKLDRETEQAALADQDRERANDASGHQ